jgi:nucleoside-diphosphate-sugar epimerase
MEKAQYLLDTGLSFAFHHRCYYGRHFYSLRFSAPQDFASLIIELTGSNSTIRNLPHTEDDPKQRRPDISLAEREIGWKPMVRLPSAAPICRVHLFVHIDGRV